MPKFRLLLMLFSLAYSLPLFPGVHHMTSTFNPPNFDILFPSKKIYLPAIQLTFDNNQTVYGLDGHLYAVPDQLLIEEIPQGSCFDSATSFFHSNALDFSMAYSNTTSFTKTTTSSFLGLFSSSSSQTVGDAIKFQAVASQKSQQYAAIGTSFCTVSTYAFASTLPSMLNKPHPDFVETVKTLLSPNPNYEDNIQNWLEFFEYYGFGQPISGSLGGVVGAIWEINSQALQSEGSTSASINAWATGQASGSLNWFFGTNGGGGGGSGSGGANGHASGASDIFLQNSKNISIWSGGSCSPPSCSFSDWYKSVFTAPAVMNLDWIPIDVYIGMVDKNVSIGSIDAMKNVSAIAALKSLVLPTFNMYSGMSFLNATDIISTILLVEEAISSSFISKSGIDHILNKFNEYGALYSRMSLGWIQTSMPSNQDWTSIVYGDGKFVSVSWNGNVAAYSIDGINWIQSSMPSTQHWQSVTYGNGKFVAISWSSVSAYSIDGINWIQANMPLNLRWYSVTYGNEMFVAVAFQSNISAYSINGINWINAAMPLNLQWLSVTYGNKRFVAVSQSDISAYSVDGINWIQTSMPSNQGWYSVTYGNGKFVAVSYYDTTAAY